MQNVCNTNSRMLIQQSEKFIFLSILVLGLQCTRPLTTVDYACGERTYQLPLRPTTPEAVYTQQQSWT